jgi:hypothetical protein
LYIYIIDNLVLHVFKKLTKSELWLVS